jgi:alkaline phosphatase
MLTGIKTKAGVIGVDETLRRAACEDVEAASIPGIGDLAAEMGKSVGVVSTARIRHAPPAALYAHSADRHFEADADLSKGCNVPDIALQMFDKMASGEIDIALGGGRRNFLPETVEDEEGNAGRCADGRNLIDEARAAGAQYAFDAETFARLTLDGSGPVLGLFESSRMLYETDRENEPSIVEMTEAAITHPSTNGEGYFLLVEGGRVDHANHEGNAYRAMTDGVAFDDAVARALDMTDEADTLIVVTADHGHAMAFNGYCGRGSPIEGLCNLIDDAGEEYIEEPLVASDGKPYTAIGYLNGPGTLMTEQVDGSHFGTRPVLTQEEALDRDHIQQAMLPLSSETHSPVDVAIYAQGPWAHLFDGTVEQSYIYHVMRHAFEAE